MDAKSFRGWLCQLGELSDGQREQLKHRLLGGEASDDARDWVNRWPRRVWPVRIVRRPT